MTPSSAQRSRTERTMTRGTASTSTSSRTQTRTQTRTQAGSGTFVGAAVSASRVWRAVRDALAVATRWTAQTVRPAGAVVVLAASVGGAAGLVFGWVEWLVAAVISLALLVMSVPFLFGARAYDVELALAHQRIVAGESATGSIVVRNRTGGTVLPGRLDIPVGDGLVELAVPTLRPGRSVTEAVELPRLPRGIVRVGPVRAVRADPVGLLRREHTFADEHELFVHPRTAVLPSTSAGLIRDLEGNPTRRLVDADMSFHAIREYAPGDAQRHIHWKSTAKTGDLMVRQYEESRRSRMAVVLAAAAAEYLDAQEYELAVSCAASLGVRAVRDAREVDIVTGSEIPRVVRGRLRAIQRIPAASPRVMLDAFSGVGMLESTMSIGDVVRLAVEANDRLSIAVVVVGSRVGLSRLRQIALQFPADTAVFAVVCDESAHPRMQSFGGLTVLTVGVVDDLAGLLVRGAAS